MNKYNAESKAQIQDSEINLKQIFEQYAYYWRWFVLSIIVCLIAAFFYLRYAESIYSVSAKILLQDDKQASGELAGLSELSALTGGGTGYSAFVSDQMEVIKSRRILRKVVELNKLNIEYFSKGNLKSNELLEDNSPVRIILLEPNNPRLDTVIYTFSLSQTDEGKFKIKDNNDTKEYSLGQKIRTPLGLITIVPQEKRNFQGEVMITVRPLEKAIDKLINDLEISPNKDKQSFIVNFSIKHPNRAKARIILNSIIEQYNDDVTEDKAKVTTATSNFINSRLELITKDLEAADEKVADFKDKNNLVDMSSEAQLYMRNATENEQKLIEYETQLRLADMIIGVANTPYSLLPSNIGLEDPSIQSSVKSYNDLVLERQELLKSATTENPIVKSIDKNINDISQNIKVALNNYRDVLIANVSTLKGQQNKFEGKLSQLPTQERGFKDISRQQQIVESLYLFLLQKREETEIQASATPANLKVIDAAYGSDMPVSPRKPMVLFGAFLAGCMIPFGCLYLKFLMDNKVHSRKDIEERFNAPILGEIPTAEDPVVKDNDRSSLAEAFRILRTNIAFMLGAKKDSAVIFVTSTTSGEGKSFVTTNLSRILAMSGKRVLLIGADIRSPKVLDYLGLSHLQHTNIGITQYLINPDMPVDNIIIHKPAPYDFDIIYSGYIAPNPAELLMNGHFKEVIEYGRENYDYVLVDTAPVSLVTDTLLISEFADLTVYVTRANYLDRRLLNVPKELYE
ncbi:polysaccharide biosynthesis tyrosine autokinase, partial [Pseudopedobacter sp.]|uniref:GumC family protein n=1 Tax=Pseudopedobacter sp. TaxID=1936787 RepID=UPI00333EDBC1